MPLCFVHRRSLSSGSHLASLLTPHCPPNALRATATGFRGPEWDSYMQARRDFENGATYEDVLARVRWGGGTGGGNVAGEGVGGYSHRAPSSFVPPSAALLPRPPQLQPAQKSTLTSISTPASISTSLSSTSTSTSKPTPTPTTRTAENMTPGEIAAAVAAAARGLRRDGKRRRQPYQGIEQTTAIRGVGVGVGVGVLGGGGEGGVGENAIEQGRVHAVVERFYKEAREMERMAVDGR